MGVDAGSKRGETLKLVEARRVESKGGVQAGLRPCGVPRSIQLGN